jgi:hypothetical protein
MMVSSNDKASMVINNLIKRIELPSIYNQMIHSEEVLTT